MTHEGSAGPGLAEVDLAAIKALIQQRGQEGARHIASWTEHYGHREGPDPECEACADIFGEANRLRDLVAEIERLHSALRAATAPQDGWKPIETAPKDATTLIGYQVKLPERWVRVGLGANLNGEWTWHQDVTWGPATYWMPLVCPSDDIFTLLPAAPQVATHD